FLFCQAIIAFSTFTMMGLLEAKSVFTSSLIARGLLILLGFWAFSTDSLDLERAVQIHILTCVVHAGLLLIAMKRTLRAHEQGEGFELFKGTVRRVLDFVRSKKVVAGFLGSAVIGYGITTWGTDILSTVLSRQPDILMLTALLGETSAQVGYYQVGAMVLLLAEYAMLFGFGGTLVAAFSALSREDELHSTQGSYPKLAAARKKVFGFHLAAATPLLVFILFFAEESVEVLFGAAFAPAAVLVQWGLVVLIVAVGIVGGGMHVTSLVSIGKQRSVFKIRLFWGLANLVGNYFLILSLGALGAVLGTQLANLGACAVESYVADKHIGSSRDHKAIVTVLAVALASVAIPWAVLQAVEIGALQSLIAGGVISLMLYLGISVLFKLSDVLHILDRLSVAFLKKPFPISAREVLS
ncbi:MAG TPA: polysaccharide biosynthesis C-terminal domain-containing protein, partial [Candidatus Kapabacteria bacterium]|nr:polysaccharide biosynthesis C-terminal domain-containing protein [Candidatus Kapabacteria bacterium]